MMSSKTKRKQQGPQEPADGQQLSAQETRDEQQLAARENDVPQTRAQEQKETADTVAEAETPVTPPVAEAETPDVPAEAPEKEEPKKPRKPRRRTRQQIQDEEEHADLFFEDANHRGRRSEREKREQIPDVLPVLPLKDTVVYPFAVQPLGVGQERSIRLIDDVMRGNRLVALVAQKSAETEQAGPSEIFTMGTVARIARMIRMPDGTIQIIVQGLERVVIGEFTQIKPYLVAQVAVKPDMQEEDNETEAIKRNVVNYFQRLVALVQNVPEGVAAATLNLEEPRQVVYVIATFVQMELELRQQLLELDSVRANLDQLSKYLASELQIFELGRKIQINGQE